MREQGDIGIMIMILGNKCDKPDEDRYVQSYELKEYALQNCETLFINRDSLLRDKCEVKFKRRGGVLYNGKR